MPRRPHEGRTTWYTLPAIIAAGIVVATCIAYIPAMRAGFVWDDPDYVINNPTLRDFEGLVTMWTDRHSLPQWYPLVHTTFWIEYQLWGLRPAGYHLVNVLLHATSAILLWRLLRRLEVPGALLAAGVFALHPVHVESVAWITERKNTLSMLFYLAAGSAFLRGVDLPSARAWRWYTLSFALFAAALLSKTVTASLPAAILLVLWWKRGWNVRLRDALVLVPFFVVGFWLAFQTAELEQTRVGAFGEEWRYAETRAMEPVARTLIAGRAVWFYVAKLVAPVNLAFIYPRWDIDVTAWWQYLFPLAAAALVLSLWLLRARIGRGPLVAALVFGGTLLPALGYFNVYPHRYSFVADHFQYHASIAMIALVCAMIAMTLSRRRIVPIASILLVLLAVQTFRQSRIYHDPVTLWEDTTEKNPGGWMPWTNLGNALVAAGRIEDAIPHYERALQLAPDVYDVQWNAGVARVRQAEIDAAEMHFRRAIEIQPRFVPGYVSLGDLEMLQRNNPAAAVKWYEQALEIAPHHADARLQYARALLRLERIDEAMRAYRESIAAAEGNAAAHYELALVLLDRGELDEAIWNLREVVRFEPRHADAHARLGVALLIRGERTEAMEHLRRALAIDPQHAIARQALRATTP